MQHYFVCKYDKSSPKYLDEWTSVFDFPQWQEKPFSGLPPEYLAAESLYLEFAEQFLSRQVGDRQAFLVDDYWREKARLELFDEDIQWLSQESLISPPDLSSVLLPKVPPKSLSLSQSLLALQLSLREVSKVALRCENGSRIESGHDFYFMVSLPSADRITQYMPRSGLYAYEDKSPRWLDNDAP